METLYLDSPELEEGVLLVTRYDITEDDISIPAGSVVTLVDWDDLNSEDPDDEDYDWTYFEVCIQYDDNTVWRDASYVELHKSQEPPVIDEKTYEKWNL